MQKPSETIEIICKTALDAVVAADENGEIIAVNDVACGIFGRSADQMIGQAIGDTIVPHGMREAHAAGMTRYKTTGEAHVIGQRLEIEALRADETVFPVELAITEIEEEGRRYFVSYIRDISERRAQRAAIENARDDAQKAVESQSQLIAMLSHDLRSPLNGISSALEIALKAGDPEEVQKAATMAQRAAANARFLTEDLLSYAQLEAGALKLNPAPTTFTRLQEEVEEKWRHQFRAKGLEFSFRVRADRRNFVMLDSLRIHQILDNFFSNALKFTLSGGVEAELGWIGRDRIEVRVADTGCGFGEFDYEQAFDRFSRSRDGGGGVGLGLWIAKSLVDLHGGEISLAPRLGGGTVARVELPVTRAPKHLAAEIQRACLKGLRVLVVDDNDTNRFVAERMLEKCGCHVEVATNGQEALERADAAFDVILMDLDMPIMDGFEATRRIRAKAAPEVASTTVIALTAYSTPAHEKKIRDAGADGLVSKPVQGPDHLASAICNHLDASKRCDIAASADAQPGPAEEKVHIDQNVMRNLADALGEQGMQELSDKFVGDVSAGISDVEAGSVSKDATALRRATHMLDAVAGTLGAGPLQELAKGLNSACHAQDETKIDDLAKQLVEVGKATLAEFDRVMQQPE